MSGGPSAVRRQVTLPGLLYFTGRAGARAGRNLASRVVMDFYSNFYSIQ